MTPESLRLFRILADGKTLNGKRYAEAVGISRAAVWKQVEQLRAAGLPVKAVRGIGYRLAWPIRLLDADCIRRAAASQGLQVEVVERTESTNRDLIECFTHRAVRVAEYQTGGRGRRGRGWVSPPGCGACFSFAFRFECGLQRLGPLSLVAGVIAAEAISREGVPVGLKWPNDLVVDDAKLGGLLVEIRGVSDGPCEVVAGIGINIRLPRDDLAPRGFAAPDQDWTDLYTSAPPEPAAEIERNELIGRLARAMDAAFSAFEQTGFEPFMARWRALDALHGRQVRVLWSNGEVLDGVAEGVDSQGSLRIEHAGGTRMVNAGEVSVRVD